MQGKSMSQIFLWSQVSLVINKVYVFALYRLGHFGINNIQLPYKD